MSANGPTVFVVDDDESFLPSVARLFRASGLRVETFSSAADFLAHRRPLAAGCVVADLNMPGMNGMELQEALAASDNPLPIVFLTGQGDIPTTVKAMRRGAVDFLTKRAPKAELLSAVRQGLERDARDRARRAQQHRLRARFDQLTPREREVLSHVLQGKLNKQIAEDFGVSERSVKRHRTSLTRKLQVQSVAELVRLAVQAGVQPQDRGPGA